MAKWYLVLAAVCAVYCARAQGYAMDPADADLTVPELIAKYGYPVETHHVTTADGYILELHRIPYGRHGRDAIDGRDRQPVLLMHGLVSSSADFIITGPEHALGYTLANEGFDVWMGNGRGNFYSRNHISTSPNSARFWSFSFEEHGVGDVIAMIDYILPLTGKSSLQYLGHSQGSTALMSMLALRPQYNAKISSAHMLAPVTALNHLDAPIMDTLASYSTILGNMAILLGINEIYPRGAAMEVVNGTLTCKPEYELSSICNTLIPFFEEQIGEDPFLNENMEILYSHMPAGGSVKQVVHYGQMISSGRFCQFLHTTPLQNLLAYGTFTPPNYVLSRITVPTYLHFSNVDQLAVKGDVMEMAAALTSATTKLYEYDDITHFGFAWSPSAKERIYKHVIEDMRNHQ